MGPVASVAMARLFSTALMLRLKPKGMEKEALSGLGPVEEAMGEKGLASLKAKSMVPMLIPLMRCIWSGFLREMSRTRLVKPAESQLIWFVPSGAAEIPFAVVFDGKPPM